MSEDHEDATAALNLPDVVNTKQGPVLVHELGLVDGITVVQRMSAVIPLMRRTADGDLSVLSIMEALKEHPGELLSMIAPATNRDATFIGTCALAEILEIVEKFLDRNEVLFQRFLSLAARGRALRAQVVGAAEPLSQP